MYWVAAHINHHYVVHTAQCITAPYHLPQGWAAALLCCWRRSYTCTSCCYSGYSMPRNTRTPSHAQVRVVVRLNFFIDYLWIFITLPCLFCSHYCLIDRQIQPGVFPLFQLFDANKFKDVQRFIWLFITFNSSVFYAFVSCTCGLASLRELYR